MELYKFRAGRLVKQILTSFLEKNQQYQIILFLRWAPTPTYCTSKYVEEKESN
jgi:hypothetical protein